MNKEEPENSIDADAVNWLQNGGGCEETRETQFSEHDPHPRCALGGTEELPAFERFGIVLANNIFRELKGFEASSSPKKLLTRFVPANLFLNCSTVREAM